PPPQGLELPVRARAEQSIRARAAEPRPLWEAPQVWTEAWAAAQLPQNHRPVTLPVPTPGHPSRLQGRAQKLPPEPQPEVGLQIQQQAVALRSRARVPAQPRAA